MYQPINYDKLNNYEASYIPSNVKNRNTLTYSFWERSLLQRAISTIIKTGNNDWNGSVKDFLFYCLFRFGFVACWNDNKHGKVFNPATLSGFNFYYQPTKAIIANPAITQSKILNIGKNCELIKLTPDYLGIWDIISYYAEKLSTLDNAINMAIINSKFAWLIAGKNKAANEAFKKIFDKINRGEPAVYFDSKLLDDPVNKNEPWQFLHRDNIKNSYITSDLLMDFQTLLNNFDTEIGIPVLPYQKKERMVTSEAESKIIDATSRSTVWIDTLSECADKVNDLFDDDNFIHFELRYKNNDEGVSDNE